jgi:tetratricopeptide (TPR) repeat protein
MKRTALLVLMLASVLVYGQKQEKPNLNKILKSYQEGKLDEAKSMVDLATTYEKTMNDGKTWYYRGLIYEAIDTTKNTAFHALDSNAFKVASEAFAKADQLGKPGTDYVFTYPNGTTTATKPQQLEIYANFYLDKAIKLLQDGENYQASINNGLKTIQILENQLKTYPNDTLTYYVVGLAAQNAENYDLAIETLNKFFARGGKSRDAYVILYQIYHGPKEDPKKALEIVQEGLKKNPGNPDLSKLEIGSLIDMDRVAEAKGSLEASLKREPDNKLYHFFLGYTNAKLENFDAAKKNYEDALKLDPAYYDAQYHLAELYFIEAFRVKREMANLGISAADKKKRLELDQVLINKYKIALPYLEKAEQLNPNEVDLLDKLQNVYSDLGMDDKAARVEKKLKILGAEK